MTLIPNRLLALKPGTRELGVAVFQDEELIYYGVKTIHDRATPQTTLREAVRILKKLIVQYRPARLVLEQRIVLQANAAFLLVVAKKLKAAARRVGLEVEEYPPAQVRQFFCHPAKATKRCTAERLTARYPHLVRYVDTTAEWERLYYAYLLDAIALGLYGLHLRTKALEAAHKETDNQDTKQELTDHTSSRLPRQKGAG